MTCGFERARRELPESSIISEKGANHVELWPKHSKKEFLVPMLYITFLVPGYNTTIIIIINNNGALVARGGPERSFPTMRHDTLRDRRKGDP